ncbi:MAG: hypothetical protein Q9185_002331 [Variospora sp. 1 TL-2023]
MADEKASNRQEAEALEKYSVFSAASKWCIVAMVSYAAWFSTLTSFIYYPAIHDLAQTFAVSIDKINLTITSYMAMATVAPTLLVGNGSMSPPKYLRLPSSVWLGHSTEGNTTTGHMWRMPNPLRSLVIIARKDNAVIILACGMLYVVYTCINTSLSVLFIDIYKLTQWQAGLTYLPFGIGGTVSTFFSGRLLDKAYRDARTERGLSTNKAVGDDLDNFPIEKARLRLCMQFDFSIYNTLLVDKNYRTPAAAQASSNIVRCGLAAIVVSFLQKIVDKVGIGWTFTIMSGLCLVALGLFVLDYRNGTAWRQKSTASLSVSAD